MMQSTYVYNTKHVCNHMHANVHHQEQPKRLLPPLPAMLQLSGIKLDGAGAAGHQAALQLAADYVGGSQPTTQLQRLLGRHRLLHHSTDSDDVDVQRSCMDGNESQCLLGWYAIWSLGVA